MFMGRRKKSWEWEEEEEELGYCCPIPIEKVNMFLIFKEYKGLFQKYQEAYDADHKCEPIRFSQLYQTSTLFEKKQKESSFEWKEEKRNSQFPAKKKSGKNQISAEQM